VKNPKHIAVVCTLDTKSEHGAYVKSLIEARGHRAHVIDVGVLGKAEFSAETTRREVAEAGGGDIEALARKGDRGAALEVMAKGTTAVVANLHRSRRLHGIIGLGGGSGTAVATSAMRALPMRLPKVMVSTMASTPKASSYVGTSDIVMVNTVTDLIGMNSILRGVLVNAVGAVCGMVEIDDEVCVTGSADHRPTVAITAFGVTTQAAMHCRALLAEADYETMIFHANGTGGRAMEQLVAAGEIDGLLDLTITELADELCGGLLTAGPTRLEAAGRRGIPQVVLPGAIDMINFATPDTVPPRYRERVIHAHSPNTTLVRTTASENADLGRQVGATLASAKTRATLILPLRGFSEYDRAGHAFHDPAADRAFVEAATASAKDRVDIITLDANINDAICPETAVARLLSLMKESRARLKPD
jgi:uncharacterized protein (UPF0261 family)